MIPYFSVVIPLYNKENFIKNTISSVLNQTFSDLEIIIVDDGSTDKSFEIVSKFQNPYITLFKQKNQGVSVARNFGIEQAKSKFIALIDADDYWHKNHLSELKKQIELFPDAGLYCNNYQIYYTKNMCRPANFNFGFKEDCLIVADFFKASIINSIAWTSAVGFAKDKFNSVGGFNTKLKTAQDLDLWIKMALKYKVAFNPTITMSYKLYVDNSLSKSEFNDIRYEFINSYLKEEKTNPSLKKYLDINRFALTIRCILNDDNKLYKKIKKEIDFNNLNFKQKVLLYFPKLVLKLIKQFQKFLIKNRIYVTSFK
ncbi:glycosyltransferase family 2 protein [Sabulilitoribacter arenilitoris]|uniref:Glycosyltransferase family 2 protein n=1 Tax=Wocania arenilitoris TaxID=2044858 RepID=A0AAE3JMM7_9FLAO|nr:glycosyltransferase family 2 protein [Wocania arenilitoris]MCF7569499.1 glycosyltransferase family 2 protein [Wocania arenilitoris]